MGEAMWQLLWSHSLQAKILSSGHKGGSEFWLIATKNLSHEKGSGFNSSQPRTFVTPHIKDKNPSHILIIKCVVNTY